MEEIVASFQLQEVIAAEEMLFFVGCYCAENWVRVNVHVFYLWSFEL